MTSFRSFFTWEYSSDIVVCELCSWINPHLSWLTSRRYVYKRLRFLNNRYISQVSALVFLAVWHGLHSGYYACFFMEFVVMNFERDVRLFSFSFLHLLLLIMSSNWRVPFDNVFDFPQLSNYVKQYPRLVAILNAGPLKYIKFVVLKLYVIVFMGYCLGPFVLLKLHRYVTNVIFAWHYYLFIVMISVMEVTYVNAAKFLH